MNTFDDIEPTTSYEEMEDKIKLGKENNIDNNEGDENTNTLSTFITNLLSSFGIH